MPRFKFQCPACNAILRGPHSAAGKKTACLKCGQRILIPQPPRQKTMLARLVFGDATSPAQVNADPLAFDDAPQESIDEGDGFDPRPLLWALIVVLVLVCVAVFWHPVRRWMGGGAVNVVEVRPEPRTGEEELVKKYILEHANDPASVTFDKWGPHIEEGVTWPLADVPQLKIKVRPAKLVQVVYRTKNEFGALVVQNGFFIFQDGKMMLHDQTGQLASAIRLGNALKKLKDAMPEGK